MADFPKSGAIKRDFEFKLKRAEDKDFHESYYGFLFAIKVKEKRVNIQTYVYAIVNVDDNQEGTAKIEIQVRNYVNQS